MSSHMPTAAVNTLRDFASVPHGANALGLRCAAARQRGPNCATTGTQQHSKPLRRQTVKPGSLTCKAVCYVCPSSSATLAPGTRLALPSCPPLPFLISECDDGIVTAWFISQRQAQVVFG